MQLIDPFKTLAPHSIEAEMCLLASMMLDKGEASKCRRIVRRDDFYNDDHGTIFDTICQMIAEEKPVDAVLLRERLIARKLFEEVGGSGYLGRILGSVPSAAHGEHYANVVREKAERRRLLALGLYLQKQAHESEKVATVDEIRRYAIDRLGENCIAKVSAVPIGEVLARTFDILDPVNDNRLKSCLWKLNGVLGGYRPGGNHVIGAVNSTGKSVLATQEIVEWAMKGIPVLHFSLEEPIELIGEKMYARHGSINASRLGNRALTKDDWASATSVLSRLSTSPYWAFDDVYEIGQIEDVAAEHIAKHSIRAMCVDHLHLVDGGRGAQEVDRLGDISKRLKRLYHKHNVVGLTVAQINRNSTYEKRMPRKSDLRGCGGIDNDADAVVLIHREDILHHGERGYIPNKEAHIIVDKNKGGKTGFEKFYWDGDHQRFLDEKPESNPFDDFDPSSN